jgi:hypothetical protein
MKRGAMKNMSTRSPFRRKVRATLMLTLSLAIPVVGMAQDPDHLDVTGKLRFHASNTVSPTAIAGIAA